jgi:hypothetical protein
VNQKQHSGGRKSSGAGTENVFTAFQDVVAAVGGVQVGATDIDDDEEVHQAEGGREGRGGREEGRDKCIVVANTDNPERREGGREGGITYPSTPMTKPYHMVSAKRTGLTSSFPFSTGGFCITSGSAFSQARPRA